MRFRLGLVTGFAVGYTLGAKAGHERYEQICEMGRKLAGTEPAQQLQSEVRYAAEKAGAVIEDKASEGVAKVSELVHHNQSTPPEDGTSTLPPA